MKKHVFLALALLIPWPVAAQEMVEHVTLMNAFDLDGEAADDDQLITAGAGVIVSEKDYTGDIVAQPDVCRLLDITISDTDMGVGEGAITVVGTDCLGYTRTCSWSAWTAADDDGVKTLTCTDGQGAYFASVTSVTTGVMTAAATDEYFKLGYTTNSANGWRLYGTLLPTGPNGEHGVNPFGTFPIPLLITTSGASSTTVTGVSAATAFTTVAVGDLLLFTVRDAYGHVESYERRVTARASATSITVNAAVTIPAAGVTFRFKHPYFSTNPADQIWVPVGGWKTAAFTWSVDANADTGGVITSLQCSSGAGPEWPTGKWVEVDTATVASGATQADTVKPIDLTAAPFRYCRFGLKFGTGDDADAANEDINAEVTLEK